ncbi:4348_t:CDS:2 [Racocetra fulgida]|uniref:4348_t:CDS:1 n=1 Tax=Racocetra fulgida TaxID=60492 RepID=A0A9N9AHX1_9GLOM|nr:4348_t:CDS:2 [Racocetra fulgida]
MNQEQFVMQQVKFRVNAKPKISKLILNDKQKEELTNIFNCQPNPSDLSKEIFTTKIWTESEEDQNEAKEYLSFQGLWPPYVSFPTSRWKTRWSDKKNGATLYQCCCGSDMESARKTEVEKQRKLRQMYDFVGCLAFIRVEKNVNNGKYRRVHGYLEHTEACHRALPKKDTPTLKVNCDIKDMTELLVRANVSIKDIISLNQYFIRKKLSGRTTLDGQYFLVTIYDVKDARRWIKTQKQWPINMNRSVDYNLETYFGEGAQDPDLFQNNNEDIILQKLLIEYNKRLNNSNGNPQEFTPRIAIIGDFRERVVSQVWNGIDLLYSPHKVRLCWETKADELLFKGGSKAIECRQALRDELTNLFNVLERASESEIRAQVQEMERRATPPIEAVLQGEELEEGQWKCLLEQHINTIAFEENDPKTWQEATNLLGKSLSVEYNGESLYAIINTDSLNPETCRDNDEMNSYSVDINLRHWTIPFIKLPSRKEALLALQRQAQKKMFPILPSTDMYDSESENESEDIDSIESYTTPYSDFNNWTSSRQIPENNESMSSIQIWNTTLSSVTNKLLTNFDDLSPLGNKLNQNQAIIPTGVNASLKTLNLEVVAKLKAVLESEQTKDLINTLKQIRQAVVTDPSGGSMNDNGTTNNNSMV